jgi:hypothetical protein
MAIRSNRARFRIKRLTFCRWKESILMYITPIIYIRCLMSRKKYKELKFYTTLSTIPPRNPLPYRPPQDLLLMSELKRNQRYPLSHRYEIRRPGRDISENLTMRIGFICIMSGQLSPIEGGPQRIGWESTVKGARRGCRCKISSDIPAGPIPNP